MGKKRQRYESYIGDSLDYQESRQIDPEVLDGMVAKLREGDSSLVNPIIKGHLRMVMGIIADSRKSRRLQADIEGAAYLALVEAVNDCCPHVDKTGKFRPSRLRDNNITYYITSIVKYMIKEEFSKDHIVCVPSRTIRYRIANGEEFEELSLPGCDTLLLGDSQRIDDGNDTGGDMSGSKNNYVNSPETAAYVMPFFIPIAKPEFPALEFTEALNKSIENDVERAIVSMRSEDCTYEEVGKRMGLHFTRIGQILRKVEERFDIHYK